MTVVELFPRDWIAEIEELTGSRAKRLHGALADSGNPRVAECPDSIAEIVATKYALTECGRLFHWRTGRLRECPASLHHDWGFRYTVRAGGVQWEVVRDVLLDRLFPDRPISAAPEIDWATYDPDLPIPGVDDPLEEKEKPGDSVIVDRALAPEPAVERAERLFWGD